MNDLAIELGTVGHLKKLERTEHGPFQLADCVPLGGLTPLIVRKGLERGEGVMAAFKNKLRLMEMMEQRGERERQARTNIAVTSASTTTPAVTVVHVAPVAVSGNAVRRDAGSRRSEKTK